MTISWGFPAGTYGFPAATDCPPPRTTVIPAAGSTGSLKKRRTEVGAVGTLGPAAGSARVRDACAPAAPAGMSAAAGAHATTGVARGPPGVQPPHTRSHRRRLRRGAESARRA